MGEDRRLEAEATLDVEGVQVDDVEDVGGAARSASFHADFGRWSRAAAPASYAWRSGSSAAR